MNNGSDEQWMGKVVSEQFMFTHHTLQSSTSMEDFHLLSIRPKKFYMKILLVKIFSDA